MNTESETSLSLPVTTLRRLWRNRAITIPVLLSLALGIGANTAIFTLVDAVFLDPPSVADPQHLYLLYTSDPGNPGAQNLSYPNLYDLSKQSKAFQQIGGSTSAPVNLKWNGQIREAQGELVTDNYFKMLGVTAAAGSLFEDANQGESSEIPPVVLSHSLWKRSFDADPSIVGKTILINKSPFQVSGIMSASFRGLDRMDPSDLWLPMSSFRGVLERPAWLLGRRALLMAAIGRIQNNVSPKEAATEIKAIGDNLAKQFPVPNKNRTFGMLPIAEAIIGPDRRADMIQAACVLMAASALVLLIAIANASNMLLSRATIRRKDMAVMLALGATRKILMREAFLESLFLVAAGGTLGVLLGAGGSRALWYFRPPDLTVDALSLSLNWRVLAFAVLLSLTAGLLANLLPALQSLRGDITSELRERFRNPRPWTQRLHLAEALVVMQVALSLMALTGADVFLKSLRNAISIDLGFDTRNLVAFSVNPARIGIVGEAQQDFYRNMQDTLSKIPGVRSVSASSDPLLAPERVRRTVQFEGQPASQSGFALRVNAIASAYFQTTDVLILRGRDFTESDVAGSPLAAIVNETTARKFWPNDSAIGKKFRIWGEIDDHTIVGVARDSVYSNIGEAPGPSIYVPLLQSDVPAAQVIVQATASLSQIESGIKEAVKQVSADLPTPEIVPIPQFYNQALWAPRMAAILLSIFGSIAVLLAATGIYAVTARSIANRSAELGVRMALGACPVDVVDLLLRQVVRLILPGLAIGAVASFLVARFVPQQMLYGVNDTGLDPFLVAPFVLALVALLASYLPVRRVIRAQPVIALRQQ